MMNEPNTAPSRQSFASPIAVTFDFAGTANSLHDAAMQIGGATTLTGYISSQFWYGPGQKLRGPISWTGTPFEGIADKRGKDSEENAFQFAVIGLRNENSEGTRLFVDAIACTTIEAPGPIVIENHPDPQHTYSIDPQGIQPMAEIELFIDTERNLGAILAYSQPDYNVKLTPDPALHIEFERTPTPLFLLPTINLADLPIKWPTTAPDSSTTA